MAGDLHVVLGASGGTGRSLVLALSERGHAVRAVARRPLRDLPLGAESVTGDVSRPDDAARVIAGATVVYHAAQPAYDRWLAEFPSMTATIADASAAAGARLVLADNLYMYGPGSSPMTESSPELATDAKGRLRSVMAADLLARHARGDLQVAIGRSPDYFGPWGTGTTMGERVFAAAIAGKPVSWIGRLDVAHSVAYLPDLARGLVVLGERPEAAGRVWHLPAQPALTGRDLLAAVVAEVGTASRIRVDSPLMLRLAGLFSPMIREVSAVSYQHAEPFVTDWSAFRQEFGAFELTPLATAIRTTLDWWRGRAAVTDAEAAPA